MTFTPQTIPSMFFHSCDTYSSRTAFMVKNDTTWTAISYAQAEQHLIHIGKCLMHLGIKRQQRVIIFANNSPDWVILDLAIQAIGAVTVPIYATLNAKQAQFIVDHAQAKIIFGDDINKLNALAHPHKILLSQVPTANAMSWQDFQKLPHNISNKDFFINIKDAHPEELASIVYTSGTTGKPKGVMLSQRNISSNVLASLHTIAINQDDVALSFLPLSHMFERTAGCYCILAKGAQIAFCPDIREVAQYIREVKPTVLVTVPRLLEKVYQKVWDQISRKPIWLQRVFSYAVNKAAPWPLPIIFNLLFFDKIRNHLGGRLRFIVSGGAALSNQIYQFFEQAGFCILQGYGLTETSPVAAVNPPDKRKIGTVGLPLQDVDIKTSQQGEILIKGPNIMQGYFEDPAETENVMTEDGYFKTGDIGTIDEDGYVTITDRIKDLIVTSGGKKIAPLPIENKLIASTWIDQACLVGEGKKTIGALIVPNFTTFIADQNPAILTQKLKHDLAASPEVHEKLQQAIDQVNQGLSQYQKIKCFKVLSRPFSIDDDEITPTLKLRRKTIYQRYASKIDSLF